MKRKLIVFTLICTFVIGMLAACGDKTDPIVGKWELKEVKFGEMAMSAEDIGMESIWVFKENGKMEMTMTGEDPQKGEWKKAKKEGEYILTDKVSNDSITMNLKDGKLIIEEEGAQMVFEKEEKK